MSSRTRENWREWEAEWEQRADGGQLVCVPWETRHPGSGAFIPTQAADCEAHRLQRLSPTTEAKGLTGDHLR